MREVQDGRKFIGRLDHGRDLLGEITRVCVEQEIALGRIEALGSVQGARLGYFDQERRAYRFFSIDAPLEITSLIGNVSLRDRIPFVHVHVTLSDAEGRAYGGHLAPGTTLYACELFIQELTGTELSRGDDELTGLQLWPLDPEIVPDGADQESEMCT